MTNSGTCPICKREVKLTKDGVVRRHGSMRKACKGTGHAPLELNNGFDSAVSLLSYHRGIIKAYQDSNASSSSYELDTCTVNKCLEIIKNGIKAGLTVRDIKSFGNVAYCARSEERALELIPELIETAQEEVQETVQETAQETAVQALTEMQCVQMSAQDLFETASNCLKVLNAILKQNNNALAPYIKEAMTTLDDTHTDLIFTDEPVLLDELFVKMYNHVEKRFYTVEETQAKAREAVQAVQETAVQAKEETPEEEETAVQDYIQKAEALRVATIDAQIKDIADLTDSNDHSGAISVLAKLVECGSSSDRALALYILKEHRKLGHMPHNLRNVRYELRERLLDKASQVLSNDQYQALRQAL